MVAIATAVRMATPSIHSSLFGDPGRNVWYRPNASEIRAAMQRSTFDQME